MNRANESLKDFKGLIEEAAFFEFAEISGLKVTEWNYGTPPYEPDIVATIDGRRIGTEITGLTSAGSKRRSAENRRFSDAIERACREHGLPPLRIHVHGVQGELLKRCDQLELARIVARFLAPQVPSAGFLSLSENELPDEISQVILGLSAMPTNEGIHSATVPQTRWFGQFSSDEISEAIERKQGKRIRYHEKYAEAWLLLTSNDFASWGEMNKEVAETGYRTEYDRAFVLETVKGPAVWELRILRT